MDNRFQFLLPEKRAEASRWMAELGERFKALSLNRYFQLGVMLEVCFLAGRQVHSHFSTFWNAVFTLTLLCAFGFGFATGWIRLLVSLTVVANLFVRAVAAFEASQGHENYFGGAAVFFACLSSALGAVLVSGMRRYGLLPKEEVPSAEQDSNKKLPVLMLMGGAILIFVIGVGDRPLPSTQKAELPEEIPLPSPWSTTEVSRHPFVAESPGPLSIPETSMNLVQPKVVRMGVEIVPNSAAPRKRVIRLGKEIQRR